MPPRTHPSAVPDEPRVFMPAEDGDRATYLTCTDPDCPATRTGTNHAHLSQVERVDGTTDVVTEGTE